MTSVHPATQAWLDQDRRRTADLIRRFGVAITFVSADADCAACRAGIPGGRADTPHDAAGTSFAYTTGLFGIGHPELLVLGLDSPTSLALLNSVAADVHDGNELFAGEMLAFAHWNRRVLVEAVPNPGEIAFAANRFYERPDAFSVELLQLTYDDDQGRFPDEPGYSLPPEAQPRPGTFRA